MKNRNKVYIYRDTDGVLRLMINATSVYAAVMISEQWRDNKTIVHPKIDENALNYVNTLHYIVYNEKAEVIETHEGEHGPLSVIKYGDDVYSTYIIL